MNWTKKTKLHPGNREKNL